MSEERSVDAYLVDGELTASSWSRALREGTLLGQRCPNDHVTAAPKAACATCGERDLAVERLPSEGSVFTETTIEVAPVGFEGPYSVAIVDLGEARVLARTEADVDIGDEVTLAGTVERGGGFAPVFRPL